MSPTIRRATSSAVFSGRPIAVAEPTDTPLKTQATTASIGFRPRIEPCSSGRRRTRRLFRSQHIIVISLLDRGETPTCRLVAGWGCDPWLWMPDGCSSPRRGVSIISRRRSTARFALGPGAEGCSPLSVPGGQGGQRRCGGGGEPWVRLGLHSRWFRRVPACRASFPPPDRGTGFEFAGRRRQP